MLRSDGDCDYPKIDLAYLDRLESLLGEVRLREVLSDGLIELADRLERIDALAAEDRREEIAVAARALIGTAGYLGLTCLSLAATDLERAVRRGSGPLDKDIQSVNALAEEAFAAMQPRLRTGL